MKHTVAFTAWNRPHYLQESLESWERVRGISEAHLMFRVEPGDDRVLLLCERATFGALLTVTVNPEQYGESRNPWMALHDAFSTDTDFAVIAEDDDVVSNDVLDYFSWAAEKFEDDERVLAVCAFQQHGQPGGPGGVQLESFHQPWIWGTWRDRWEQILRDDWDFNYSDQGFDWHIRKKHVWAADRLCVFPCESRSQQIGKEGVHFRPEIWHLHASTCFKHQYPDVAFSLVT